MLVIKLVPHDLSSQLRNHACALQLLDERLPKRVKAPLRRRPVLAHVGEVPTKRLGDPVALPVHRRRLGGREQSRLTSPALFIDPLQETHLEEFGMEGHRPKANLSLHFLMFALVRDADARNAVLLEHILDEQLSPALLI